VKIADVEGSNSLPDAFVRTLTTPYTLTPLGAAGTVTFTPTNLPPGISLSGGILSGTPTTAAHISFNISDSTDTVSRACPASVRVNITTGVNFECHAERRLRGGGRGTSGGTGLPSRRWSAEQAEHEFVRRHLGHRNGVAVRRPCSLTKDSNNVSYTKSVDRCDRCPSGAAIAERAGRRRTITLAVGVRAASASSTAAPRRLRGS
jgi:hypothetical protein